MSAKEVSGGYPDLSPRSEYSRTDEPRSKIGRADKFKERIVWHERNHPDGVSVCKDDPVDAIAKGEAHADTVQHLCVD